MSARSCKVFAHWAACCLALALTLPTVSWARPGVNGLNVTTVYTPAPSATYRLLSAKRWIAETPNGKKLNFVEEKRDQWSVYLIDAPSETRLQLDLYSRQVFFSDRTSPRRALHAISDDSAEVNGWNVSLVTATEGQLRMTGPGQWIGVEPDGSIKYNFVEENRDQWSVYLNEVSAGVRLQIDLRRMQVFGSSNTVADKPLYPVTGAWAIASANPVTVASPMPSPAAPSSVEINLALGRAAQQSTTDFGGDARRAVDGNRNGAFSRNSVSHTAAQPQSWWQVDLGAVQAINNIRIWNRVDCCADRLSRFYVFVSDSPFTSENVNATYAQPGVTHYYHGGVAGRSVDFNVNRSGRYVRVQLLGTGNLQLAEVEVYGRVVATQSPAYPITTPHTPPYQALAGQPPAPVLLNAPPPYPANQIPPNQSSALAVCTPNTCGRVEAINVRDVVGTDGALGAVIGALAGAALGNQVGSGTGKDAATIAAAAAGAIAGYQIDKNTIPGKRYEVVVRLDDGSSRVFVYTAEPGFPVGTQVRDVGGTLHYY